MICIGLTDKQKDEEIARYCAEHTIRKVVIFSPSKFRFVSSESGSEHIEYDAIITYKVYYRLLQETDDSTLLVINECLRTQNRNDLTFNCVRHYLNQTPHQLIFQYLPIIDTPEDFATLFDFDTRSRWKRVSFTNLPLREAKIRVAPVPLELRVIDVQTDERTLAYYAIEKRKLIDGIGLKDPHTIPRNLHLISGKAKLLYTKPEASYLGRNDRLKLQNMTTYKESAYPNAPYVVFEFCHNLIDFADFLALSRQTRIDVLVTDLKVDRWYLKRYQDWIGRLREVYTLIGSTS